MVIQYGFVNDGGFLVMVPGFAEYAYPSSEYARRAARNPKATAKAMVEKHYHCALDAEFLAYQATKTFINVTSMEVPD